MNPGKELDALIMKYILPDWVFNKSSFEQYDPSYWECNGKLVAEADFSPSEDIADAWLVVEKLRENFQVGITYYDDQHECEMNDLRTDKYYPEYYGRSKISAPHAICLAALKVIETNNVTEINSEFR